MFNRLSTNTPNSKKSISNDQLSLFNNVVCLAEQGQESHQTKVTFNLTDAAAEKLLGPAEAGDDALPAGLIGLMLHPQLVKLHSQSLDLFLNLNINH